MQQLKNMLAQQHREIEELTTELQRKEVTPDRIIRLIKIVRRNLEILERMAAVMDAMGAPDLPDTDIEQRLAKLAQTAMKKPT